MKKYIEVLVESCRECPYYRFPSRPELTDNVYCSKDYHTVDLTESWPELFKKCPLPNAKLEDAL